MRFTKNLPFLHHLIWE